MSDKITDKFIQYNVTISASREQPQPNCILLESQLKGLRNYFVHWSLSEPTVFCEVSKNINCIVIKCVLFNFSNFWTIIQLISIILSIRSLCGQFHLMEVTRFHYKHMVNLITLHLGVMEKQRCIKVLISLYLDFNNSRTLNMYSLTDFVINL